MPLEKPYRGFNISSVSHTESKYKVELSWDENAYIHPLLNDNKKAFINILVTKYKTGKPYYETLTVSFNNNDTSVSVEEPKSIQKMYIHPNPNNGIFNILVNSATQEEKVNIKNIIVFDVFGKIIYQSYQPQTNIIDISNFKAGLYIVNIETSAGISRQNVVIQ